MKRAHALVAAPAALLLFGALAPHEYGYYTFLRWVVTIAAVLVVRSAVRAHHSLAALVPLPFGIVAILFNPIFPVFKDRSEWVSIDLLCGLLFLVVCFLDLSPKKAAAPTVNRTTPPPPPGPPADILPPPAASSRAVERPGVTASTAPIDQVGEPGTPVTPSREQDTRPSADGPEGEIAKARALLYGFPPATADGRALLRRIAASTTGPVQADALCELGISLLEEDYGDDDEGNFLGWHYSGDLDAASVVLQEAADLGSTRAMTHVATLMSQYAIPRQPEAARALLERAAAMGDTEAMRDLARLLTNWDPPDHLRAEEWMRKRAETGDSGAMLEFAEAIEEADPSRGPEAEKWLRRSATAGSSMAAWSLATRLGRDPQDWPEARRWMQQAAREHDGAAAQLAEGFPETFAPDEPW